MNRYRWQIGFWVCFDFGCAMIAILLIAQLINEIDHARQETVCPNIPGVYVDGRYCRYEEP